MTGLLRGALLLLAIPALSACATTAPDHSAHHGSFPEATPFKEGQERVDLEAELAMARVSEKPVLVIFGANWCHDSRALAGWLQSDELAPFVDESFAVIYIDAGVPQTGDGQNLDVAARFGVTDISGTPTMLVIGPGGELLNTPEDAKGWRNAASRSGKEIKGALESYLRQ